MSPIRERVSLLALCLFVGLIAGCSDDGQADAGGLDRGADRGRRVDVVPAPPNLPHLPDYEVEVCGWAEDPVANDCFAEARAAGRGAEIFFRYGTIEGDTVYAIGRVSPNGEVTLFLDYTDDAFGGRRPLRTRLCDVESFLVVDGAIPWSACEAETRGW